MTFSRYLGSLPILTLFVATTGGGGGFVDITTSGIDDSGSGVAAAWGDFDGDGDEDVYVVNAGGPVNVLHRALGGGAFLSLPLPPLTNGGDGSAAWADFDQDGDLDLAVRELNGAINLFRNEGGISFVSVGPLRTPPAPTGRGGGISSGLLAPAWGDYDADGDLDLYVNNFGANRLLRNDGGTFVDVASGALADADLTTSARWVDTDGDGDVDLYFTTLGATNRLLRNDGGTFADVTAGPIGDTGDALGQAWGDMDGDGDFDLVLLNQTQPNRLFVNNGGNVFVDGTPAVLDNAKGASVSLVDYDVDADLDIFIVSAAGPPNALLRNDGGSFVDVTASPLRAVGASDIASAWADVDGDLDLDVYIVSQGTNRLLRNDEAYGARIAVHLIGSDSNRDGVGAVLTAYGTGTLQRRQVSSGGGVGESARYPVLAATTQGVVDSLVVAWPSGVSQVYSGIEDGVRLDVHESDPVTWVDATTPTTAGRAGSFGVAWIDFDGDEDEDVYLSSVSNPGTDSQLLRNDDGTFVDVTPPELLRLGFSPGSEVATWADYDNDGDLDLFRGREGNPNQLLRNDGGAFVDVTPPVMAAEEFAEIACWGDYDLDGDLDLFAGLGSDARLFRNDAATFVDMTTLLTAGTSGATGAMWVDADADGDPDLAISTSGGAIVPLLLYRNDGGTFALSASVPRRGGFSGAAGLDWGDMDGDGDLDLVLSGDDAPSLLYRNDGSGVLVDVTPSDLADIRRGRGCTWFDADNDADVDLLVVQGEDRPSRFFRNDAGTLVADYRGPLARTTAGAKGAAPADVDGDGDLDVLIAHRYARNALLRNDRATGNHWLFVALEGATSNRDGVGARIRVVTGSLSQVREVHAGFGHHSQAPLVQHVGLGSATLVDSVVVDWPSGRRQVRTNVAADQRLSVVEPPPAWTEVALSTSSVLAHAWGDVDGDGDPDLYLCRTDEQPNQLFRNDGGGTFVEVTSGDLRVAATTNAAAWGDYDHDDDLDLLLATVPGNRLVRNDDGVFVAIDDSDLVAVGTATSVAWTDLDRDGDLDPFLGSDASRIYRNDDGAFVDVSGALAAVALPAVGASWGDYDGDLDPDLYVSFSDPTTLGVVFRNDDGAFVSVQTVIAPRLGGGRGATFGAGSSWGDVDNDGDLDLFALFVGSPNRLFRNDGNDAFVDIGAGFLQNGLGLFYGCSMADVDRDGDLDLLAGSHLYRNDGSEQFVDVASDALAAPSVSFEKSPVSFVDYDLDSDLDVFLSTTFEGSAFFRNAVDSGNNYVTVTLRGTLSNRAGVGARVELFSGGTRQLRTVEHSPGYNAQEPNRLYLGLGSTLLADSLVIRWPSGNVHVQAPLPAGSYLFQEPDMSPVSPGSPDVAYEAAQPAGTRLLANAPNPFNPRTRIPFHVAEAGRARLDVFDVAGRSVRRLLDRRLEPGRYRVTWDGRDQSGVELPSGTYFVRLAIGGQRHTRQLQLLK